jgi:photosynthetic reaction center cytochrome c subunit
MRLVRTGSRVMAALAAGLLLAGCEPPPQDVVQSGFRGTAMEQVYNPKRIAELIERNQVPTALDPVPTDGPRAKEVYQNVKVLGDLGVGEFTRLMVAMTNWVSPNEGCLYCHTNNFAEDTKYTKVVARKMIQMTQKINVDWKPHVADTGVTCYTCHRGEPVPRNVWFAPPPPVHNTGMLGDRAGQNSPAEAVKLASLPYDPFGPYLSADPKPIRIIGDTALPTGNRASTKQAEFTYSLMMHMSDSLGVNCTYCHNSRAFGEWSQSPPQRTTAWYGIRMARQLNVEYMDPLTGVFPKERLGPTGDVAKVSCGTCHQGAYKPLFGASMLKDHPELGAPRLASIAPVSIAPPAAAPAAAAPAAADPLAGVTVLFGVGSAALGTDAIETLKPLVDGLKANPDAKVSISGFHSATGDLATNQDLAKRRAFSVRGALLAAGVADDRMVLEKPLSTEANLSGEDPRSRRVDVTVK